MYQGRRKRLYIKTGRYGKAVVNNTCMAISVTKESVENQHIEIDLLIEAVYRKYGYDFRNYSGDSVRRRIMHRYGLENFSSISEMLHRVLNDEKFLGTLILDLSINTTEMFRDPSFYRTLRTEIFPLLNTYPSIKKIV